MRALIRRHGIRFSNNRYDVNFVMETLHELHIERLQSVTGRRNKIETAMHSTVWDLPSRHAGFRVEELLVFRFDVVDYWHPTGERWKMLLK